MSEDSQSIQENISTEKVLLIDLENCPDQIHQLQKSLEGTSKNTDLIENGNEIRGVSGSLSSQ
jgi:hypothetical protein